MSARRTRNLLKLLLLPLLSLSILLAASGAQSKAGSAFFSTDVPAGKWKGIRLTNLPRDAALEITARSDGPVLLLLLNEASYAKYPRSGRPLFRADVLGRFSFSVRVPAAGHYYIVLHNRSGPRMVKVDLDIRAARGDGVRI